jgi:hypothetical protein
MRTAIWDFGDGAHVIEAEPTHTYRAPGEYQGADDGLRATAEGTATTALVTVLVLQWRYMMVAPEYVYVNDRACGYLQPLSHG